MMKKYFVKIVISILFFQSYALFSSEDGDGGQSGGFLRYGVGGRAMGMGRAFVSVSNDASGIYWNPGGIVGSKRLEIHSMYSNLFYDSRYAYFGMVIPRPVDKTEDRVINFLIGPSSAVGFGWISLDISGFKQTTNTGKYLGDFGIAENAFLVAWAREEIGSWGLLRYGFNGKFVNQNYPGLQTVNSGETNGFRRDWSGGMDVGLIFQPIHTPIFRIVSLRYLLPLRFGLAIQNIVRPNWDGIGGQKDYFPRVVRFGVSYRWVLKDWIPSSWESIRSLVGRSSILTAYDRESYQGPKIGHYFGAEGYFPFFSNNVIFSPRVGFNNRTEGTSCGAGLTIPFAKSAFIRLDYSYSIHPYLTNDSRFFMTVQMGKDRGIGYFKKRSKHPEFSNKDIKKQLLLILSEYPNIYIEEAAEELAVFVDSLNAPRYYDLTGGLGRASWLLSEARRLLKQGRITKAQKMGLEAAQEYSQIFMKTENALTDDELLAHGEALIIGQRFEESIVVLNEVEKGSLRLYYLLGTSKKALGDWEGAIESYSDAVKRYEQEQDKQSMVSLSFLGLAESLIKNGQFETAMMTLDVLLRNYPYPLDPEYPRFPIFDDNNYLDEAQFLIGLCYLSIQNYSEGIASLFATQKYYPDLSYGLLVNQESETLLLIFKESEWEKLDNLVLNMLNSYYQLHKIPTP